MKLFNFGFLSNFRKDKSDYNPDDFDDEIDENEDDESISVYEAALIWLSNGKDEDYTFGYSEEELEDAL